MHLEFLFRAQSLTKNWKLWNKGQFLDWFSTLEGISQREKYITTFDKILDNDGPIDFTVLANDFALKTLLKMGIRIKL